LMAALPFVGCAIACVFVVLFCSFLAAVDMGHADVAIHFCDI